MPYHIMKCFCEIEEIHIANTDIFQLNLYTQNTTVNLGLHRMKDKKDCAGLVDTVQVLKSTQPIQVCSELIRGEHPSQVDFCSKPHSGYIVLKV